MEERGYLNEESKNCKIIYADDEYINQQTMVTNLKEIGIDEKLTLFHNGQEVVDYFQELLRLHSNESNDVQTQPIALLFLDINMPLVDGFETSARVKQLFELHNQENEIKLLRPMICFLSHLDPENMTHFITEQEKPEIYFEKPVSKDELASLATLINLI